MIADEIRMPQRETADAEPKCWVCDGHGLRGGNLLPDGGGYDTPEVCDNCHGSGHAMCSACEGGGWESYGLGRGDPHFRECPVCHNPEGRPSP